MQEIKNLKLTHGLDEYKECPAVMEALFQHNLECAIDDLVALIPDMDRGKMLHYFLECYNAKQGTTHAILDEANYLALSRVQQYAGMILSNAKKG